MLLFFSTTHGESFSTLANHVSSRGPCLIVLRDRGGYVFGGFASTGFQISPQFCGRSRFAVLSREDSLRLCRRRAEFPVYIESDYAAFLSNGLQQELLLLESPPRDYAEWIGENSNSFIPRSLWSKTFLVFRYGFKIEGRLSILNPRFCQQLGNAPKFTFSLR